MKSIIAFWVTAGALLGGLLFWRNTSQYRGRSVTWRLTKSAVELTLLLLTAAFLPALLIVWLVMWVTRPIKTPWIRLSFGLAAGIFFGFLSNVAVEVLVFLGLFSLDAKTGTATGGVLNCWQRATEEETSRDRAVAA